MLLPSVTLVGQLNAGFNMGSRDRRSQPLMTTSVGRGFLRQTKGQMLKIIVIPAILSDIPAPAGIQDARDSY